MKQNEVERLKTRIENNEKEAAQKQAEAAGIMAKFTDATGAKRDELSAQWRSAQSDIELLEGERSELQRRFEVAYLAPFELAVQETEREAETARIAAGKARQKMQVLSNERLRFMNRGGRNPETEQGQNEAVTIDADFARSQTESRIAAQNAERAGNALQRARAELDAARQYVLSMA